MIHGASGLGFAVRLKVFFSSATKTGKKVIFSDPTKGGPKNQL